MKVFNEKVEKMSDSLEKQLSAIRLKKNFKAKEYIEQKALVLNAYMLKHNLKTCIVAISGGIDSAVVLGIARAAKQNLASPIAHIQAVAIPSYTKGVSNQKEATMKAISLAKAWGIDCRVLDLSKTFDTLSHQIEGSLDKESSPWVKGQLVPCLRTSSLYYMNSLYWDKGENSIILGTINKSEGAHLGYMGKAGDAMVDIQLISDLYKSEVYQVAQELKVIPEIMLATPSGDMYDNRSDEEVFGVSYDFVELYLNYLEGAFIQKDDSFYLLEKNLGIVIDHNAHKYLASSPAVHLDLYSNDISGWGNYLDKDYAVNYEKIINLQSLSLNKFIEKTDRKITAKEVLPGVIKLDNVLSEDEVLLIKDKVLNSSWQIVGRSGYQADKTYGSRRLSLFDEDFSLKLFNRVKHDLPPWMGTARLSGLAKLFRFISYDKQGQLLSHQDESFCVSKYKKTLMSFIIYLSEGQTKFGDESVRLSCGQVLVFPHDLWHESMGGQDKMVIRTDVVYEELLK